MITKGKLPASSAIGPKVKLDPSAIVGEGTIISGQVEIRDGAQIGRYCVVEGAPGRKTVIGSGTVLEDFVRVHPGVFMGEAGRVEGYTILGHPTKADLMGQDNSEDSERVRDLLVEEPRTVIGSGAMIRSHSVIYTHVEVGASLITGKGIMIREHTRIGNNCVFGTNASTDGYCRIGSSGHIGQYSQLSQAARIGDGVFIGGHTVLSDNRMAIRDVSEDLCGANIEDYVRIGLACVILPAIRIGTCALIGAGSIVTRNVPERALAYGNPARIARQLTDEEVSKYLSSVGGEGLNTHP